MEKIENLTAQSMPVLEHYMKQGVLGRVLWRTFTAEETSPAGFENVDHHTCAAQNEPCSSEVHSSSEIQKVTDIVSSSPVLLVARYAALHILQRRLRWCLASGLESC